MENLLELTGRLLLKDLLIILMKKTKDVEAKKMLPDKKEEFYSKNKLYEFQEDLAGMGYLRGKKVILVDDVVTQGFAAEQCLKELSNQGVENLCFYCVATTKMR